MILLSVSSMVLQNTLFNYVTKKRLNSASSVLSFNMLVYLLCIAAFGALLLTGSVSWYTVGLGVLFGVVTSLTNVYKLLALTKGPMHLTLLFTTSSMIIPAISGIFWGEPFSIAKLLAVFALMFFLYLSFEKNTSVKIGGSWFLYCLLAFLLQGAIGVLQKIHQGSAYKEESAGFLFVAFAVAEVFCVIRNKGKFDKALLDGRTVGIGLLCGGCTFAMNYINLKLSGLLPSQLFFPLVNGSAIVLSSLTSVLVFKEKLTKRQTVGLIGGILSLCAVCILQ